MKIPSSFAPISFRKKKKKKKKTNPMKITHIYIRMMVTANGPMEWHTYRSDQIRNKTKRPTKYEIQTNNGYRIQNKNVLTLWKIIRILCIQKHVIFKTLEPLIYCMPHHQAIRQFVVLHSFNGTICIRNRIRHTVRQTIVYNMKKNLLLLNLFVSR